MLVPLLELAPDLKVPGGGRRRGGARRARRRRRRPPGRSAARGGRWRSPSLALRRETAGPRAARLQGDRPSRRLSRVRRGAGPRASGDVLRRRRPARTAWPGPRRAFADAAGRRPHRPRPPVEGARRWRRRHRTRARGRSAPVRGDGARRRADALRSCVRGRRVDHRAARSRGRRAAGARRGDGRCCGTARPRVRRGHGQRRCRRRGRRGSSRVVLDATSGTGLHVACAARSTRGM